MSNNAPFVPWMHSLLDQMKELYNKPNARTIAEALPDITGALHYKGTKETVDDLPSSGNDIGDVWHITEDGSEWAWDGSEWQDLGSSAVSSVNGKTGAVVLTAADVGAAEAETVVEVSGTTPTITPIHNRIYNCGEVASLTISNPTATGAYSIVFTSGATATVTTFPASILGLEDFAAEANTVYEINVLDNRAVVGKWAVSA